MSFLPLSRDFYERPTITVAKELLGKIFIRRIKGILVAGIISETEAYGEKEDEASHAFRGMTPRNEMMFGEVGMAYIYFTYGMHYCVNVVAKTKRAKAGAVLLRALMPIQGIEQMIKARKRKIITELVNGPAKLTQAFTITKKHNGIDLTESTEMLIAEGIHIPAEAILQKPRIGISRAVDKLWNFSAEIFL